MNIFFDNIIYSLQRDGGISRYFKEIKKIALEKDIFVRQNSVAPFSNSISRKFELFLKCRVPDSQNTDVFHSSYYRVPGNPNIPSVVTIHDLAHERGYVTKFGSVAHSLFLKKRAIYHASQIICISESTKKDLFELYPGLDKNNIHVVYNGLSDVYKDLATIDESIYRKYCLFIGSRASYKKFDHAVRSVNLTYSDINLYVVGGGEITKKEKALLDELLPGRYEIFPAVNDEILRNFYRNAICLLYPSLYEGFGIPIIEAFSQGCPTIIYNNPACIEISKGEAIMCESEDYIEMSEYIKELFLKGDYANFDKIIKIGRFYDWSVARSENKAIYQQCLR